MSNFKYLLIKHEGKPATVMFSTSLRHDDVARLLNATVLGAGHVRLWPGGEEPHMELCGRSGTLDIDPVREDAEKMIQDYKVLRGKSALLLNEPL